MPIKDIESIHWSVFSNFKWQPDIVTWNKIEHWDRPKRLDDGTLVDDCDGFAIECWYLLKESGYSPELAVCQVPAMGGHCVCLCDGMVLDNRFRSVYKLTDNPGNYYDWARSDGNWRNAWINFRLENK